MPKSKLEWALHHARNGFRVFPLIFNGKLPAIKGWPRLATTDEKTIRPWWEFDNQRNIGIATGKGLVVIDADCKPGQRGAESLALFEELYDPPTTYRVRTPTGGIHVYLSTPPGADVRNSANQLDGFPHLDVRGEGGFVVAEGSTIDGRAYEAIE